MKLIKEFFNFKKMSLVISNDLDYTRIIYVHEGPRKDVLHIADIMEEDGTFEELNVQHYDIIEFDSIIEMNNWIQNNLKENQ